MYLDAFNDSTYSTVIELVKIASQKRQTNISETGQILQKIYGELACDTDSSGNPYHIGYPPCPNCGERKWPASEAL